MTTFALPLFAAAFANSPVTEPPAVPRPARRTAPADPVVWPWVAAGACLAAGLATGFWAGRRRRSASPPPLTPTRRPDSQVHYRELFDQAGFAVFATDRAGRLTELNAAGAALFGCDPAAAVGTELVQYAAADQAFRVRAALAGGRPITFDLTLTPAGRDPVEVEVTTRPAPGPGGGLEGIARNVGERKRLETQLRQAQKLEAIGRLAGGVAHDFNNLLTVINGCGELLHRQLPADSDEAALAADVRKAGQRAAALTGQLLAFSRQRVVVPKPLDLNEVVRDTAKLLRRLIREDVALKLNLGDGLPRVKAETGLLTQILLNLAVNARDAMPHGGTLAVTTEAAGTWVRLRVADTGCGMDAATQAKVFEPFFTTKAPGQGTGLGLATVYGTVQSLNGRVRFESAVGRGTVFEIDLPTTLSDPGETPAGPALSAMPADRRACVLLVEDDEAVRGLAVKVLQLKGYEVLPANGPRAALTLATEYPGPIDLLVTDVVMPGMNGRELAAALEPVRPRVRVLYMSGYTSDEVLRDGVQADRVEFLQKPFTPGGLANAVRQALGAGDLEQTPVPARLR